MPLSVVIEGIAGMYAMIFPVKIVAVEAVIVVWPIGSGTSWLIEGLGGWSLLFLGGEVVVGKEVISRGWEGNAWMEIPGGAGGAKGRMVAVFPPVSPMGFEEEEGGGGEGKRFGMIVCGFPSASIVVVAGGAGFKGIGGTDKGKVCTSPLSSVGVCCCTEGTTATGIGIPETVLKDKAKDAIGEKTWLAEVMKSAPDGSCVIVDAPFVMVDGAMGCTAIGELLCVMITGEAAFGGFALSGGGEDGLPAVTSPGGGGG